MVRRWQARIAGAVIIGGLAVGSPAGAADARTARPLALSGGKAAHARICGATRQALAVREHGRVTARLGARVGTLTVRRCSPSGRWVRWETVRPGRSQNRAGARLRLPVLVPGGYRITGRGVRATYFRIAGTGSGLRDPETGRLYPLLDTDTVRAPMVKFCDGPDGTGPKQPDATPLPTDPRTLVNSYLERQDMGTYFNASWMPVHDAPGFRPTPTQFPKTCGGFRQWAAEGKQFLESQPFFQLFASAKAYDNIWRAWGLQHKPVDFDQEVADRYGLSVAPFRNPYPRPGEDPKATGGGSGQLPLGLIQGRNKDGTYNGKVTITCSACHDSVMGDASDKMKLYWGRGSDSFDASLFGVDLMKAAMMIGEGPEPGGVAAGAVPFPYSVGRGLTDAFGLLDYLPAMFDMETLDTSPGVEYFPNHGAAGQVQTPNWWNRSHRTRMFYQGELSGDNTRVSMALAVANADKNGAERRAMEPSFERVHVFFDSLSPPPYPGRIDEKLAEEGAIIFHTKDLWADPRNKDIPRPMGNGSCASCHGVYSPRFAHDPQFLPDPRLMGIEANITPIQTIQTDKARTNLVNEQLKRAWDTSWWGYDELNPKWTKDGQGQAGTSFQRALYDWGVTKDRLAGPNIWSNDPVGYEAPPLYGIWASAPYFHNGSVPTVRDVLRPKERPDVWTRPRGAAGASGIVQGFDRSMKAYDLQNLGYKVEKVACNDSVDAPGVPCHPKASPMSAVESELSKMLGDDVFLANQDAPPNDETDRQRRMITNTHDYSLGNGGHVFSQALSEQEVRAVLEYLKTL